jgi:hypothetical protein
MPDSQQIATSVPFSGEEFFSDEDVRTRAVTSPADPPPGGRDQVVSWLAVQHFAASPEITDIYYLRTDAPEEEIRLLEVNRLVACPQEEVEAVDFGFDIEGLHYRLLVADISPAEHQRLESGTLKLPGGWTLQGAWHWGRR